VLNLAVNLAERCIELTHQIAKRNCQRGPPPDQHIVEARPQSGGSRQSHHLPQPATYPITLYGSTHLARHGEANAHNPIVAARARLQHKGAAGSAHPTRRGPKVAAALQPLDDNGTGPSITH
jgi:hypothetical protein